jgi:DNA-binding transcriptional MerR regulator
MAEPDAPRATQTGPHLSIGEVLALLLEEFPDITISKIRFLESQGLIDPERTASGYRKFYADDVELLRCILREQRENYLPLKVIKDRIDSGEIDPTNEHLRPRGIKNVAEPQDHPHPEAHPSAGHRAAADHPTGAAALFQRTPDGPGSTNDTSPGARPQPSTSTEPSAASTGSGSTGSGSTGSGSAGRGTSSSTGSGPSAPGRQAAGRHPAAHPEGDATAPTAPGAVLPGLLLSFDELCAMAGLSRDQLAELRSYGVVVGTSSKGDEPFDEDAVEIATICKRFLDAGIEARHLRGWRVAADREVGLLEQLIQPLLRQRNPDARAQAIAELIELEEVGGRLRSALMRAALRRHGGH